jgi:hypothetical protein
MVPPSKKQASLLVAIRVRPILKHELAKGSKKDIIRVLDRRVVMVLDPDESKVGACALQPGRVCVARGKQALWP